MIFNQLKIQTIVSNLQNEADKSIHDSAALYSLLHSAAQLISTMTVQIAYLQRKLEIQQDSVEKQ